MRKFVTTLALMLTMMCGAAAAETFTGPITTEFQGVGDNFRRIQVEGNWIMIGCGPDSGLSEELLAYLDDHWDNTGSVTGDVVNDPHWGLCIDNVALAEDEPKAEPIPKAPSKLAEYDWIRLPSDLTSEEMEIVETSLTDVFWDPVYQVPMKNYVGVCRYFHDRGFTVDVDFRFDRFTKPEPDGTEGIHKVIVTMVNRKSDVALTLMIAVIYTCPAAQTVMIQKNGDTGAKAFLMIGNGTLQTERYTQKDWRRISGEDWFVIMRSIIDNGYVQEG
ncbi:hypothetical protein ACR42D_04830 [Desulfovibrio caledoniensis]